MVPGVSIVGLGLLEGSLKGLCFQPDGLQQGKPVPVHMWAPACFKEKR